LGQFDAASPVAVTETNTVTKIFYKNAALDVSPSPVDSKFEENCDFNPITPVYHEIVDTSFVGGEGECAAKCAVSCSGTDNLLCQFYKYDSCSKSCTLGNFKKSGTETPLEFDSDKLPLSAIKLRTGTTILGTSLFTTTGTFCTGAAAPLTITSAFSQTFSTAPSAGANCLIFLYKPSNLKGKVKMTLGSSFTAGTVDVVVGEKATNGVRICEKTANADTCEWYDGLVTVKWAGGAGGTPAGSLQFTYSA